MFGIGLKSQSSPPPPLPNRHRRSSVNSNREPPSCPTKTPNESRSANPSGRRWLSKGGLDAFYWLSGTAGNIDRRRPRHCSRLENLLQSRVSRHPVSRNASTDPQPRDVLFPSV